MCEQVDLVAKARIIDANLVKKPTLNALESEIADFDLPPSPLDALLDALDQLGHGVVELTGRSHAWRRVDGSWIKVKRGGRGGAGSNTALCAKFQRGEVRCAVISAAASCGISLHDTTDHTTSRPRLQIMVELAYAADA